MQVLVGLVENLTIDEEFFARLPQDDRNLRAGAALEVFNPQHSLKALVRPVNKALAVVSLATAPRPLGHEVRHADSDGELDFLLAIEIVDLAADQLHRVFR